MLWVGWRERKYSWQNTALVLCESKRQWPNLASTYQDAKVRSDWVVYRILTWGHPRSMDGWLAKHVAQNRNKSCWLTEIYFIRSINCDLRSRQQIYLQGFLNIFLYRNICSGPMDEMMSASWRPVVWQRVTAHVMKILDKTNSSDYMLVSWASN